MFCVSVGSKYILMYVIYIIKNILGTGEIDQLSKCLLYKHGNLRWIPRTCVKKPGVTVCNPSFEELTGEPA